VYDCIRVGFGFRNSGKTGARVNVGDRGEIKEQILVVIKWS
jgi:hypothetical protein